MDISDEKKKFLNELTNNPYKKGFIFSKKPIKLELKWKKYKINDYSLYIDPSVSIGISIKNKKWVCVIGSVIDTCNWIYSRNNSGNELIAKEIFKKIDDADLLQSQIDCLSGRFVIIYNNGSTMRLQQDAMGARSVYYSKDMSLISTHYELLNSILKSKHSVYWDKYCAMSNKPWVMIGNLTPYDEIFSMVPNHELIMDECKISRIWPKKEIMSRPITEVVDYVSSNISKQLDLLCKTENVCLQLTGGNDSRVLLALSKNSSDKITYFTYHSEKNPHTEYDYDVARDICDVLKLNHLSVNIDDEYLTPEEYHTFSQQLKKIHYCISIPGAVMACKFNLPQDALVIRGSFLELLRGWTYTERLNYNESCDRIFRTIFWKYYDTKDSEISEYFKKYFYDFEYDKLFDYQTADIIYSEYRMQMWLSNSLLSEEDWAYDVFMPFDCRNLIEACLSVPAICRATRQIQDQIILKEWPLSYWHVPNTCMTQPDYNDFDFNRISFENVKIYSKNIYSDDIVPFNQSIGIHSCVVSFCNNYLKVGDCIEINVMKLDSDIDLIQNLFTTNGSVPIDAIKCEIKCGKNSIYFDDLSKYEGFVKSEIIERDNNVDSYSISIIVKKDIHVLGKGFTFIVKNLRRISRDGTSSLNNPNQTLYHLRNLVELGICSARTKLFDLLWNSKTPDSYSEMVGLAKKYSDNDAAMSARLGRAYREGRGVDKNLQLAASYMRNSISMGADWIRGELFDVLWELNTPESFKEMIDLAKRYSENDATMSGRLGRAYREGKGVDKNLQFAIDFFDKARVTDVYWLNEFFDVLWKENTSESVMYLVEVAKQYLDSSNADVFGWLGIVYQSGKYIDKNEELSKYYFEHASNLNNKWKKYLSH